jgi:hypothetical protein
MNHLPSAAKVAALACCMNLASAHAEQWDFTFHNLHHTDVDLLTGKTIDYGYTSLNGSFIAFDDDHNGVISTSEVDSLYFGGVDSFDVTAFTYSGGSQLTFQAYGYRAYVDTNSGYSGGSGGFNVYYRLNSSSYITVNPAPVPEVASSALLLTGLLALAGAKSIRFRKERNA